MDSNLKGTSVSLLNFEELHSVPLAILLILEIEELESWRVEDYES